VDDGARAERRELAVDDTALANRRVEQPIDVREREGADEREHRPPLRDEHHALARHRHPFEHHRYQAEAEPYDEGHPDQAADTWSHAVRLQPARGEAHEGLAEALLAAKRPAEARREAEEARRLGRNVDALLAKINAAAKK